MSTTGFKFLFTLCGFGLVAAAAYGLSTGGDPIGVITLGYKGGVGEHAGYTILVALAVLSGALGSLMVSFRDADPASVAEVAATDALPRAEAPAGPSSWPVVAAFGAATLVLGAATSATLFVLGAIILVIAVVEWTVQAWADRATGDPEVNRTIRNRLMYPIEMPAIAVLVIGGVAVGFSRVFLALPKTGATIVAIVVTTLVFAVAVVVALRPKISRSVVGGILLAGGLAVLIGGVVGAAVGEREFEEHGEEHGEEHSEEVDESGVGPSDSGEAGSGAVDGAGA
jgi:hypothetical protein